MYRSLNLGFMALILSTAPMYQTDLRMFLLQTTVVPAGIPVLRRLSQEVASWQPV